MEIKPLQDRILIRRLDSEEEMSGGIVIPDTAKEKPQEGEVVAVGDGTVLIAGTAVLANRSMRAAVISVRNE